MKTVIGAFDTFAEARSAVDALERAGFNERDVSIVANNANDTVRGTADTARTDHHASVGGETVTGAVVGGLAGLIVGLAPFVIPGLGAIAAAGWLTMTLTGAAIGAGVGLIGALMGIGVPEEEAHYYNETVRRGGTLVLVRAEDDLADNAARILSNAGAIDIDERAAQYRNEGYVPGQPMPAPAMAAPAMGTVGTTGTMTPTPAVATANPITANSDINANRSIPTRTEGETAIPVVEEQVNIGKQQVQRGGVRVYRHVTETPVNQQVNLREEHVNVERRPVDRPAAGITDADLREGTIEVRETAEVPVIQKQARVVEEVVINKDVTERVENINDTVRRTDVQVEEIPGSVRTTGTAATGMSGRATGDTRNPLEKAEDFVTGDNIDDKTGQPVSADTRNIGEKAADAVQGNRR